MPFDNVGWQYIMFINIFFKFVYIYTHDYALLWWSIGGHNFGYLYFFLFDTFNQGNNHFQAKLMPWLG